MTFLSYDPVTIVLSDLTANALTKWEWAANVRKHFPLRFHTFAVSSAAPVMIKSSDVTATA